MSIEIRDHFKSEKIAIKVEIVLKQRQVWNFDINYGGCMMNKENYIAVLSAPFVISDNLESIWLEDGKVWSRAL